MKKFLICLFLVLGLVAALGQSGGRFIAQWQNGGTLIGTFTSFLRMNCSTGMSCSYSGGTVTLTATGTSSQGISAVSYSATPTFSGASGVQTFKITLTGDVTSSTFSNGTSGMFYTFIVCQDSTGGRAFVPPTQMKQYDTWMATPSSCVTQSFAYDGTNLNAVAPWTPDIRPLTANAMDDEFDGNAISGLWTQVNQSTSTQTLANGFLAFNTGGATAGLHCIVQNTPATPYTFRVNANTVMAATGGGEAILALRESATGKFLTIGYVNTATDAGRILVRQWTSTTASSNVLVGDPGTGSLNNQYFQISAPDSSNVTTASSADGINYVQQSTQAKTTPFTTAPDQVGVCIDLISGTMTGSYKWFRRTL